MSQYRRQLTQTQEAALLRHCSDARYVWNLCLEQESWWRKGRSRMPGFAERCRQLTAAREGDAPARLLVLHAPAMDAYFEELHQLWSSGQAPSREAELELMSRYGMEPG
jgi:Helix-turn-helix domain